MTSAEVRAMIGGIDPLGWRAYADFCEETGKDGFARRWRFYADTLGAVIEWRGGAILWAKRTRLSGGITLDMQRKDQWVGMRFFFYNEWLTTTVHRSRFKWKMLGSDHYLRRRVVSICDNAYRAMPVEGRAP